ncbi:MAG TPA: hypothetical protein VNI84_05175 [Pyrinomonadaceae bacterium]|nr:hypothetical protein [Pyrinomonadaceae bacterium]
MLNNQHQHSDEAAAADVQRVRVALTVQVVRLIRALISAEELPPSVRAVVPAPAWKPPTGTQTDVRVKGLTAPV